MSDIGHPQTNNQTEYDDPEMPIPPLNNIQPGIYNAWLGVLSSANPGCEYFSTDEIKKASGVYDKFGYPYFYTVFAQLVSSGDMFDPRCLYTLFVYSVSINNPGYVWVEVITPDDRVGAEGFMVSSHKNGSYLRYSC